MTSQKSILSTKSLDKDLLENAKAEGYFIVCKDFISIQSLVKASQRQNITTLFSKPITALFTSSNTVRQVFRHYPKLSQKVNWQVFCINGNTQVALSNYIEAKNFIGTAKNARELFPKILSHKPDNITFFCGKKRRPFLPETLSKQGIPFEEIIVYDTLATPHKIVEKFDAILFYSPSGVKSFFSVNEVNKESVLVAIGETTVCALRLACGDSPTILVSPFPSSEKMLTTLKEYLEVKN